MKTRVKGSRSTMRKVLKFWLRALHLAPAQRAESSWTKEERSVLPSSVLWPIYLSLDFQPRVHLKFEHKTCQAHPKGRSVAPKKPHGLRVDNKIRLKIKPYTEEATKGDAAKDPVWGRSVGEYITEKPCFYMCARWQKLTKSTVPTEKCILPKCNQQDPVRGHSVGEYIKENPCFYMCERWQKLTKSTVLTKRFIFPKSNVYFGSSLMPTHFLQEYKKDKGKSVRDQYGCAAMFFSKPRSISVVIKSV